MGLISSYSSLLLPVTWLGMWVALLHHAFPQHATALQQGQRVLGWKFQYYESKSTFLFIYWFLWIYYYSYRELTQTHSKAHRTGLLSCSTTLLICPSPSALQFYRLCSKVLVTSVGRQSLWRTPTPAAAVCMQWLGMPPSLSCSSFPPRQNDSHYSSLYPNTTTKVQQVTRDKSYYNGVLALIPSQNQTLSKPDWIHPSQGALHSLTPTAHLGSLCSFHQSGVLKSPPTSFLGSPQL